MSGSKFWRKFWEAYPNDSTVLLELPFFKNAKFDQSQLIIIASYFRDAIDFGVYLQKKGFEYEGWDAEKGDKK